ncbi:MAG: RluA family pseudouridine synthase [Bacteroidia bacterium]
MNLRSTKKFDSAKTSKNQKWSRLKTITRHNIKSPTFIPIKPMGLKLFQIDIDGFVLNDKFEYPHFYTPTPIALKAANDLKNRLRKELPQLQSQPKGRMLGVLVVETENAEIGYLSAYSGELQPELEILNFVPPVHQLPKGQDFTEMAHINAIGKQLKELEKSTAFLEAINQLNEIQKETEENIKAEKQAAKKAKAQRHLQRKEAEKLPEDARNELLLDLAKQGAQAGMDLRRFTRNENIRLEQAKQEVLKFEEEIQALKHLRKTKSAELQNAIFRSFVFKNSLGESKDALDIFIDFGIEVPPAGAGECAAPKLFQYAFLNNLKPIALAEFWWGPSPNSIIREHGNYYPACKGKCQPILSFMLKGIPVKSNPLLENTGEGKTLEILYEDQHIVVINKPSGMLSVPGKHITDSVQTRIQHLYPNATGPLVVHRLDQDTSGIIVLALSKEAHKNLQKQFLDRSIQKTYVAVLEKPIDNEEGIIDLPLILDVDNRPMQMVNYKHGKPAISHFKVLEKSQSKTLIELKPVTGRSHQLRVHCAHKLGLHAPIIGDNLYGNRSDRLYLHAQKIEFTHPFTNEPVKIETKQAFSV